MEEKKLYVFTLTATRENIREGIIPSIDKCGLEDNLVSTTMAVFDDLLAALTAINKYFLDEKEKHGSNSYITMNLRGNDVSALVCTIESDECGNAYVTKVEVKTLDIDNKAFIAELVRDNYI
jgi:hypothetical protein